MRIHGTFGFEPQGVPNRNKSDRAPKSDSGGKPKPAGGSLLQAAHNSVVSLALQSEEVNIQAVDEARRLLETGQLDTPEAARRAAQTILDLGF